MRVLVAGADPLFRRYLCRAIGVLGHDCEDVIDGATLITAAAARPPDAVLSDLDPEAAGLLGSCAELRRERPDIRLLAVTDDPASADAARRCGLDLVLLKPFSLAQLRGALFSF